MYEAIIKNYIKKASPKDVRDFASKYDIYLKENEENIIYDVIQNNYKDIMKKHFDNTISTLKNNLSSQTFDTLMSLYDKYKKEIDKYLPLK